MHARRKGYGHTPIASGVGGVVAKRGGVFLREGEDAENAAHTRCAFMLVDVGAHHADVRAGIRRACEQGDGARWRALGRTAAGGRRPAAWRTERSRQKRPGGGGGKRERQAVPLHLDALADPAGRCAVVRRFDFDAAIKMDGPLAVPVIAKRFDRRRPERRLLLGKHHSDLALRGPVDGGVAQAGFQAIKVSLGPLERLEAGAAGRGLRGGPTAGLTLAFGVGLANSDRGGGPRRVRARVAIPGLGGGRISVWGGGALLECVGGSRAARHPAAPTRARVPPPRGVGDRYPHNRSHLRQQPTVRTDSGARGEVFAPRRSRIVPPSQSSSWPSSAAAVVMTRRAAGGALLSGTTTRRRPVEWRGGPP